MTIAPELREKLQELKARILTLRDHLEVDKKLARLNELEQFAMSPDFWSDTDRATEVQKEQGMLQNAVAGWDQTYATWEEAELLLDLAVSEKDEATEREVAQSLKPLEQRIEGLELECMFSGEHDLNNALVTIHAGAGGTEAQDWSQILLRMYLRWAEQKGFATEMLDELPGDEAGIKSVTILVKGRYAYGHLRSEMGIHRLVRISPFDAGGRRHTSFSSVFIFPELEDTIEIDINEKDLRIDTFRASGAGGQHVNKTSSAIRITHLPTGIVVQCQNERSQHRNRDMAMKMLRARLYDREKEAQAVQQQEISGEKKEIAWGSQIRSYVLQPYRLIKDHRTNHEVGNVDAVLDGDLDGFIKAFLLWSNTRQ
ncbi:MAG: peptide chain release factor 2 [Thermodesulfobacteriota bacterium]